MIKPHNSALFCRISESDSRTLTLELTICLDNQSDPWADGWRGLPNREVHCTSYVFADIANYAPGHLVYGDDRGVSLDGARRAVKLLSGLDRAQEKLNRVEGYAESLGAYVNRLARILGAKALISKADSEYQEQTGWKYRQVALGNIAGFVNRRVAEWREKHPLPSAA